MNLITPRLIIIKYYLARNVRKYLILSNWYLRVLWFSLLMTSWSLLFTTILLIILVIYHILISYRSIVIYEQRCFERIDNCGVDSILVLRIVLFMMILLSIRPSSVNSVIMPITTYPLKTVLQEIW